MCSLWLVITPAFGLNHNVTKNIFCVCLLQKWKRLKKEEDAGKEKEIFFLYLSNYSPKYKLLTTSFCVCV